MVKAVGAYFFALRQIEKRCDFANCLKISGEILPKRSC